MNSSKDLSLVPRPREHLDSGYRSWTESESSEWEVLSKSGSGSGGDDSVFSPGPLLPTHLLSPSVDSPLSSTRDFSTGEGFAKQEEGPRLSPILLPPIRSLSVSSSPQTENAFFPEEWAKDDISFPAVNTRTHLGPSFSARFGRGNSDPLPPIQTFFSGKPVEEQRTERVVQWGDVERSVERVAEEIARTALSHNQVSGWMDSPLLHGQEFQPWKATEPRMGSWGDSMGPFHSYVSVNQQLKIQIPESPSSVPASLGWGPRPAPEFPHGQPRTKGCQFCKQIEEFTAEKRGEGKETVVGEYIIRAGYHKTHDLKNRAGEVICPVLFLKVCEACGATGAQAHTDRYCPKKQADKFRDLVAASSSFSG